jgi:hypothetical protein
MNKFSIPGFGTRQAGIIKFNGCSVCLALLKMPVRLKTQAGQRN